MVLNFVFLCPRRIVVINHRSIEYMIISSQLTGLYLYHRKLYLLFFSKSFKFVICLSNFDSNTFLGC